MRTLIARAPAMTGVAFLLAAAAGGAPSAAKGAAWTQWGGPGRNFMVESTGLASSWPAAGPRRLWERALGEGH
jgi:hypothetical protein